MQLIRLSWLPKGCSWRWLSKRSGRSWKTASPEWRGQQVQKWTKSEKSITGMLCLRGDDARYRHQWRHDHHDCLPRRAHQHEHLSVPCLVHLVSAHRHTLHMHRMAQVRAVSVIHPIHMRSWCVRFSLDFDLSFLFTFYLTHLLSHSFHFFTPLEVRRQPAHSAQRDYGLHWRDLLQHNQRVQLQFWAPVDLFLKLLKGCSFWPGCFFS